MKKYLTNRNMVIAAIVVIFVWIFWPSKKVTAATTTVVSLPPVVAVPAIVVDDSPLRPIVEPISTREVLGDGIEVYEPAENNSREALFDLGLRNVVSSKTNL